jgi:hypothetical protein
VKAPLWKGSLAGRVRGLVATRTMKAAYLAVTKAARRATDPAPNGWCGAIDPVKEIGYGQEKDDENFRKT